MLSGSNENYEAPTENGNFEKKPLTFKDWKSLKDFKEKSKQRDNKNIGKPNVVPNISNNKSFKAANSDVSNRTNYNNSFNSSGNQFNSKNFLNNLAGFLPFNNSIGTSFDNNNRHHENMRKPINNCFNNFSPTNNFLGYTAYKSTNSIFDNDQYGYRNSNRYCNTGQSETGNKSTDSCFGNDQYGYRNSNRYCNTGQSENFFATDSVFPQSDTMQKPLLNPFRYGDNGDNLLKQFNKSRYNQDDKMIKNKKTRETQIYIHNPKSMLDGRPYIPKPKIPEPNFEITLEEKKQQWREYRLAMKPFKNRDFYNAKRTVQRLGKKSHSELNEKEVIRLTNAREYMATYKARLYEKYPNYAKAENSCGTSEELNALKTVPTNQSNTLTEQISKQNNQSTAHFCS